MLTRYLQRASWALLLVFALAVGGWCQPPEKISIGSKAFPESWILGDMLCTLAREAGAEVQYSKSLGATQVIFDALRQGQVDVYPEYLGTIKEVFLKDLHHPTDADVLSSLAAQGIGVGYPLGFNDGYAMAVHDSSPLRTLSDSAAHPEVRVAMDGEFRGRKDGWGLLVGAYGMHPSTILEMQHELCYTALAAGKVDATNVYTTDGQISKLKLRVLTDDKKVFPLYDAVLLYRAELPARSPKAWAALCQLVGKIDDKQMSRANAIQVVDKKDSTVAADALLNEVLPHRSGLANLPAPSAPDTVPKGWLGWDWGQVGFNTGEHLKLVGVSLLMAISVGIPLGVIASKSKTLANVTLSGTGLLQTIPSLALLAFLVPILGVGAKPALVALFLYSLLPIVRNTYTGLTTLPGNLSEAAEAIGLTPSFQLFQVRLPMASPSILGGIKTSAVINVGTATLAALVGANGLGQPIMQGIQLLDQDLIFQGAIPAAVLALLVQWVFDLLERVVVPKGLRL